MNMDIFKAFTSMQFWEFLCFTKSRIIIYGVWFLVLVTAYLFYLGTLSGSPLSTVKEHC